MTTGLPADMMRRIRMAEDGCWEWRGAKSGVGYGLYYRRRTRALVHRVVYEICRGPIPTGLQIDHLCRVRLCVNPAHMEAVTSRTNTMRGLGVTAINARRTHCPQGHEYTPENTYSYGTKSGRHCRTCNNLWKRQGRRRQTSA